jgi:hypothetical protein
MSKASPQNITEASAAVAALPGEAEILLSGGERLLVKRLSWLKFELVWDEIAGLLAGLLAAGEDAGGDELVARLSGAPAAVLKLVSVSTGLTEGEVARWPVGDVLSAAATAIKLNFVDSAVVRGFFSALSRLAEMGQ